MSCYCGNKNAFNECCHPIISSFKKAETPEQLMRSRFSAYAIKNADYLFKTYAAQTRKLQNINEIKQWAEETKWLKLTIINSEQISLDSFNTGDSLPTVEFIALYHHDNHLWEMSEVSRFTKEHNHWFYLDGEVCQHKQIKLPKRNELCVCHSKKKFKHCCSQML